MRYLPVTYSLTAGTLPPGLDLDSQTGQVIGNVLPFELSNPTWETPAGRLGNYTEGDVVSGIPLEADPTGLATSLTYSIVTPYPSMPCLPFGLILNPTTGVISGTVADQLDPNANSWVDEEEPDWISPASGLLGTFYETDTVTGITLVATSPFSLPIRYSVVDGSMPWGLTLDTWTGNLGGTLARLKTAGEIPIFEPKPLWLSNSGSLGNFDEQDTVILSMRAIPRLGTSIVYDVIEGGLPYGTFLNRNTGFITGTLTLPFSDAFEFPEYQAPVWQTPSSQLFEMNETDEAPLTQLRVKTFNDRPYTLAIVAGTFPWGLTLGNDKIISGVADRLWFSAISPTLEPKPNWITPSGSLGTVDAGESVDVQVEAAPLFGDSISYEVDGGLPYGLILNKATGHITGTTKPVYGVEEAVSNPPTFAVSPDTIIATTSVGNNISYALGATASSGRTIRSYSIFTGTTRFSSMPYGISLNTATGEFSGTLDENNIVGTYYFSVRVIDSADAVSTIRLGITIIT